MRLAKIDLKKEEGENSLKIVQDQEIQHSETTEIQQSGENSFKIVQDQEIQHSARSSALGAGSGDPAQRGV